MTLGFTGTHHGMTTAQLKSVRTLLNTLGVAILHHGDCIGADAQADRIAKQLGAVVVIHPPLNERKRAFCDYSLPNELREAKPYLARNRDIVSEGIDGLVAAPRQTIEPDNKRGQGTWTTIGYARQAGRNIWIVLPDGKVRI